MKKVLITGASRRIGASLAIACAKDNWHVVLHYNKNTEMVNKVKKEIFKFNKKVEIVCADLSKENEVEKLIESANNSGKINALINNASIFNYDTAATFNPKSIIDHITVNSIAPAILIKNMFNNLSKGEKANVVNILDAKLFGMNPDYFSYTLSKALLDQINKITAQEFAPFIRINAIAPGIVLPSGKQSLSQFKKAHKKNPLKNGANIDELIKVMHLLLNTKTMTGEVIILDGGNHLQPTPRDVAFMED